MPLEAFKTSPDTSGIPRPIDTQPTSPTVSVPDLTTPELAALWIAGQEPDEVGCAKCQRPMDGHPSLACESYIDPDFNAYQDSDDE